MRIANKQLMYKLLRSGYFGNAVYHWDSFDQMVDSPYNGNVGVRLHTVGTSWKLYNEPMARMIREITARGWEHKAGLEFYEAPPDDKRVIQGELMYAPGGLYFRYTFANGPMRLALKKQELHSFGLETELILRQYVNPGGIDWLKELLHRHDGAVIEFTEYSVNVGTLSQTTLIWEGRHY